MDTARCCCASTMIIETVAATLAQLLEDLIFPTRRHHLIQTPKSRDYSTATMSSLPYPDPPPSYLHRGPLYIFRRRYLQPSKPRFFCQATTPATLARPTRAALPRAHLDPAHLAPLCRLSPHHVFPRRQRLGLLSQTDLLSSCHAVEATASLAASLPHLLAANHQRPARPVRHSYRARAARVFDLSITAIEREILSYIVESYKSLSYASWSSRSRVAGGAHRGGTVDLPSHYRSCARNWGCDPELDCGVNDLLSVAVSGINDVVGVFGQHLTAPRIAVPSLTALENITLPHEIQDGLVSLTRRFRRWTSSSRRWTR